MATEAPSWADQWGAGGIGAMEEEDNNKTQKGGNSRNKNKAKLKGGFGKAKAAAFKWMTNTFRKKNSSK